MRRLTSRHAGKTSARMENSPRWRLTGHKRRYDSASPPIRASPRITSRTCNQRLCSPYVPPEGAHAPAAAAARPLPARAHRPAGPQRPACCTEEKGETPWVFVCAVHLRHSAMLGKSPGVIVAQPTLIQAVSVAGGSQRRAQQTRRGKRARAVATHSGMRCLPATMHLTSTLNAQKRGGEGCLTPYHT